LLTLLASDPLLLEGTSMLPPLIVGNSKFVENRTVGSLSRCLQRGQFFLAKIIQCVLQNAQAELPSLHDTYLISQNARLL